MSRIVHVNPDEGLVVTRCMCENISVSAIERLASGAASCLSA